MSISHQDLHLTSRETRGCKSHRN